MANVQRELTESSLATIYGCCGLFDLCGKDDLMSLTFEGANPFIDWIGWSGTDVCEERRSWLNWIRPDQDQGAGTPGYVSDPCAPANTVEFGVCEFLVEDFGRLRRAAPTRDVTRNRVRLCDRQPRYRLDGTPITDEREFNSVLATEVILQDLKRMVITGDATTAGQFDGLENLVVTGYTDFRGRVCESMDSIVVEWNSNDSNGGAGMTWNGVAMAVFNLVDVLRAIVRRIRQRVKWSPSLSAQEWMVGDIVIMAPDFLIQVLLDAYTCWSVCPGAQFNEANLNTLEGRTFRDNLQGGMFGDGRIFIDNFEIPCIAYDWETIKNAGGTLGDMYVLTGSVGTVKTLMGEYLLMDSVPADYPEAHYFSIDGGRMLGWIESDETCVKQTMEWQGRIISWAPFLNARIQNISGTIPGGTISPDPESPLFPQQTFVAETCP